MRGALRLSVALGVVGFPILAGALTLGELQMQSGPGQPFRATVDLVLDENEKIYSLGVGSASEYALLHIPRPEMAQQTTVQLEYRGGQPVIELRGSHALREQEPVLLLRVASSKQTYLPFFRLPAQPAAPEVAKVPSRSVAAAGSSDTAAHREEKEKVYGPVRRGETLDSIAGPMARGAALSALQVQIALWRRNPDRFVLQNMNGLKNGVMLVIPSLGEMARVDQQEARAIRQQQFEAWKRGVVVQVLPPTSVVVEPVPAQVAASQEPLQRIVIQLQGIQQVLEKNQGQLERIAQRISALENGQAQVRQFEQRLTILEERLSQPAR